MKKILIITGGFDGRGGGKIASVMENYFSKMYNTVTLVSFYDAGYFPINGKKINIGSFGKKFFPGRGYIALIPHILNTIWYIKKEKPDIVISIGTYSNFLGMIAKKFLDFKLLLTQHVQNSTIIKYDVNFLGKFILYLSKKLIGNNKIVCVGKEVMEDTIKFYKIKSEQAYVVYNGLDFAWIKDKGKESINISDKFIINIGALSTLKNQEMLIRSYAKTKCKNEYKLLFLGDGGKKDYLIKISKDLNVDKNVIFYGFEKNPYKFLSKAAMFCFTSFSEALPTVLIESLILKTPILTVPVTGAKEILGGGKYGIITKGWDIDEYSKLLDYYINKYNSEMLLGGYEFAEMNFKIPTMIEGYEKIINIL